MKTIVGETHAGVILENSSMEVDKVNLSTVLDRNNLIPGEADVAGNKEIEESKREKDGESLHDVEIKTESLKEKAIEKSDVTEKILSEMTVDREKEECISQKTEEVQESLKIIETPSIQAEETESKASKSIEEQEHVVVRDIPKGETLVVPEAETVDTSTVQERDTEPSLEEQEKTETVKTNISSDEVQESIAVVEPQKIQGEEIELKTSKELKEDVDQSSKDTKEDAHDLETKEDTQPIMDLKEEPEKLEEIPLDLALKVEREEMEDAKTNVDQVDGTQTMEEQRVEKMDLDLKDPEAEQTDRNRTDETEESLVEKVVAHVDVEPVEKIEKQYVESPLNVPEEEVTPHQQGQEDGSFGLETKEETVSLSKSSELGDKVLKDRSVIDLTPLQEESCLRNEQIEKIEKHEPENKEVAKSFLEEKSGEVIQISSASHSEEREGETVVEAEKIEESIKPNVEEQLADKIQKTHEPVEVKEEKDSRTAETSVTEVEYKATVSAEEIAKDIANETASEDDHQGENEEPLEVTKNLDVAEKISSDVTGDIEKEEDKTLKIEEVKESHKVIETPTIQEENIESNAPKDVLVRDMPQSETLVTEPEAVETSKVQEAAILKTLETTHNETETEDTEPSLDLKLDKEKDISCDKVKPYDQVVVQAEEVGENSEPCSLEIEDEIQGKGESVEVNSKEAVQEQNNEEKHENRTDVPSGESEKTSKDLVLEVDKEELKNDKKNEDKVDGTQTMDKQRGLDSNEQETEKLDRNRTDETEETPVEVLETTSTTIDEKIKEEEEEVALHHEGQETRKDTFLVTDSCLPKETKLEKELIEKHEPANDQQSPLEEKSYEVIQVPSASASEEQEGGIDLDAEKIKVIKANEEEQVAETITEIAESHISLPLTASEKIEEEEKVKEEEPIVQTRDVEPSLTDKYSMDQTQEEEEQAKDEQENVTSETEKGEEETTVRDMSQGEAVDTLTIQDSAIFKTLETTIHESEAVHSPIGGEEEKRQMTKEDTSLELKEDKQQEETEMVKTVILSDEVRSSEVKAEESGEQTEYCSSETNDESHGREESVEVKPEEIVQEERTQEKDDNLVDVLNGESDEKMQKPSLESPFEVSEETSKIVDEKIDEKSVEEVTLQQESQEEKTISVAESSELGEKETKLTKENLVEKHESTGEEDTNAHQTHVEEKTDEVIRVSSALPSEKLEGETLVEAEMIEDIKANEEEEVAEKIQRSLETDETTETAEEQVRSSEVEAEEFGEHTEHCRSDTNDESLGREESGKVKSEEIVQEEKDDNLVDVVNGESAENMEKPSLESPLEESKETSKTADEKIEAKPEKKATMYQESQEEKKISVVESSDHAEKAKEEESSSPIEQEKETKLQKENVVEKHKSTSEEDTNAHQIHVEENTDEAIQVSSESTSEEREGETGVAAEKIEEVVEKNQRNLVEDDNKTVGIDGLGSSKKSENVESLEALKLEESNKDKSQEVSETAIKAIEATGDHTLAIETSEEFHTPTFISELEDKIPKQIEEIHEEETNEAHTLQVVVDQSLPVKTSQEETKESHNVEVTGDRNLPVETSQAHQEPSSEIVMEIKDIHGEETKSHKLQEEEINPTEMVPRESFSEPAASNLASGEYNQVTVQEGHFAGETQEKRHVSAETEDSVVETVPTESDDQIETSTKVTKEEDEDTNNANVEMADITKEESMSHSPETSCLKQEDLNELGTVKHGAIIEDQDSLMDDFTFSKETREAEHGDESSSTLPVVGILKELQTTLENERAIKDSASSGENMVISSAESNGKDLHSIKSEEEEEETLEKDLVTDIQDSISRELEVNVGEKLQEEEETREIAEGKEEIPASALPIEELEHVVSAEKQEGGTVQEGATASIAEKISPQEEHPIDFETSKKEHETVKEEDQIFDIKEEKKNAEVQDEKLEDLFVRRGDEESFRSGVKTDKEDASELRLGHEFDSVPESEEDIKDVDTSETPSKAEKELIEEHVQKSNDDNSLTKEALDKQLQVPSSEVEVKKVQEEEPVNALISNENLQVQEHPKDFEQEKKLEDSVVSQKEEAGLIEEKRDVENVKTEPADAIKHGLSIEMKNIDQEATKEIYPEKSKQTETVTSIKQEEKKTTQECFSSVKNTDDDAIEKTKPAMQEIENLSSLSRTQDISKQKDDEVPKLENLKTAEELQQKDEESHLSEVKESEAARKSLSDLIQKVERTNKTEDTKTQPHIKEEAKTEEEDEDGDEKASPDSLVMVEAKDTVIITKTHQKKPHGILSGVGSKVKHSISKVKKAFTGKSSHKTTKPLSPK